METERFSNFQKESLTNLFEVPSSEHGNVLSDTIVTDYVTENGDNSGSSSSISNVREESSTASDKESRYFDDVKALAGAWDYHRFKEIPWDDRDRPIVKIEKRRSVMSPEEMDNAGLLTKEIISDSLFYLERSPEFLHYALAKCVLKERMLTDISEIRCYHYIQYLDLSWNSLTTLEPLGQLIFLQYLDISHNSLEKVLNFKPPFYLSIVNYSFNQVRFLPDLTDFWSITNLNLSNNQLSGISGLQNLKYLSRLDLSHNNIQTLENLNNLRLQFLYLSHNHIDSFELGPDVGLKTLCHIRTVDLSHNKLESLKLFRGTENLESINVSHNRIRDLLELTYLSSMRYLSRLNLTENPIIAKKHYFNACVNILKHLMHLDDHLVDAERRVKAMTAREVDPTMPTRQTRMELLLAQQINRPAVGPHILPYDQPPPMVILLVGPPAAGKKGLAQQFSQENKKVRFGVSHTTRAPTLSELPGEDYYFVQEEEFKKMVSRGEFVSTTEYNGYLYGIAHEELQKCVDSVLVFYTDIGAALTLKIMGIHPKMVLAMPRDEHTHLKWLKKKYFGEMVEASIFRIKNSPSDSYRYSFISEGSEMSDSKKASVDSTVSVSSGVVDITLPQIGRESSVTQEQSVLLRELVKLTSNRNVQESNRFEETEHPEYIESRPSDMRDSLLRESMVVEDSNRGSTSSRASSGILKRYEKGNKSSITEDVELAMYLKEKYDSKRVSFSDFLNIEIVDDQTIMDPQKKSVSQSMMDTSSIVEDNVSGIAMKPGEKCVLSVLSSPAFGRRSGEPTVYMTVEEKLDEQQSEKLNIFFKGIMESRQELLELHWANPGLFRDMVFTDEERESLKKLKKLLKFTIENYRDEKPVISFEDDECFKNITRSRLRDILSKPHDCC